MRRARDDEAPLLAELWSAARHAATGVPPTVHSDREVLAWFRDVVVPSPSHEVWLVSEDEQPVGLMVLGEVEIEQLYVAPGHLRRGHGSRLLGVAMAERERLTLWTFEANSAARAFYEAHGFRICGEPSSENEEGAPALRYEWTR